MNSIRKVKKQVKKRGLLPDTGNWKYAQPQAMWKSEIAKQCGYDTVRYFFNAYVHNNSKLMCDLKKTGYRKRSKWLTQKQVDLILDTIGYQIIGENDED